jgi:Spy/CpxP family protein refolding chaperone
MKTRIIVTAMICSIAATVHTQSNTVAQFLHDQPNQDSIIATIVHNHSLMSKLIDKISEDPQLHKMVIQHLSRLLKEKQVGGGEHNQGLHETMSHYVGDEKREIKALSQSEVDGLLNGEGVGLAMAAELNHYPGPRHILDLAEKLALTDVQKKTIQEAFDRMHAEAVKLGSQLVEQERLLDKAFASLTMTQKSLTQMTEGIEKLRGQLRRVHLAAHLETRSVLTPEQIDSYDRLRGYSSGM